MNKILSPQDELREILKHYQIGDLSAFVRDERGFVNVSYTIESVKDGQKKKYFLRRYKKGVKQKEIQFEHSLINHLLAKKFPLVARILPTSEGKTFICRPEDESNLRGIFYAIFDFLPGEDKYTWIDPTCSEAEVISAAQVLASFHRAVFGFQPEGGREEPEIANLLPIMANNLSSYLQKDKRTPFDAYLLDHYDLILDHLKEVLRVLSQPEYQRLPRLVIHCDYHPGNLKFRDNQVIGLFDFDWSKIDTRCFDVALALNYFFIAWGDKDGQLQLDRCARFIRAYQDSLQETSGIGPLDRLELKFLPDMISASNLYVLNWTLEDYYNKEADDAEYLGYLEHGVNFIKWFRQPDNRQKIDHLIDL